MEQHLLDDFEQDYYNGDAQAAADVLDSLLKNQKTEDQK